MILTFRKSGLLSFTAYLLKMQTYIHREMQCAWEAGPGRSERNLSGPSSVHGVTKSQTGLSNFHTHSAYQAMCILWTSYQHTHAPIYSYSCFAPISTIESSLSTHEELVPGPPPPPLAHAIKCVWVLSHVILLATPWTRALLSPWNFPGENTGVGCHSLLQGIFPTQVLNLSLLHWQAGSLTLSHLGSPLNHL